MVKFQFKIKEEQKIIEEHVDDATIILNPEEHRVLVNAFVEAHPTYRMQARMFTENNLENPFTNLEIGMIRLMARHKHTSNDPHPMVRMPDELWFKVKVEE